MSLKEHVAVSGQADPLASPVTPFSPLSPVDKYHALIGDVNAPITSGNRDDIFHSTLAESDHAKVWIILSGLLFFILVATQIILCLGIAVGAQTGFSHTTISVLAAVNTVVAAGIGGLKGLGLPDKKMVHRDRLKGAIEQMRFTSRQLRAGLEVDVEKAVDDVRGLEKVAQEDSRIHVAGYGISPGPARTDPKA